MIETKQGFKNTYGNDRKILFNNKTITFTEFLELAKMFFINENNIYPSINGFIGAKMLFKAIIMIYNGITPKMAFEKASKLQFTNFNSCYKYLCDNPECRFTFYEMNYIYECPKCKCKIIHIVTTLEVI